MNLNEIEKQLQKFSEDKKVQELQEYILTKIEEEQNKFNIFKVLKFYEIRHSNFLAWLLNPNEKTHGYQDKFLKQFLEPVLAENLDNVLSDISDIVIETEFPTNINRRIDILVHSKKSNFVCVIENKYGSDEHNKQCKHYKDFIDNVWRFKDFKHKYYVFLDIDKPDEEKRKKDLTGYYPVAYEQVYEILKNLSQSDPNETLKQTVEQYMDIIKENYPMLDEKIKEQCREIYKNHKNVIEMMDVYKKDFQTELFNIMHEVITDKELGLKKVNAGFYNDRTGCGIHFVPIKVDITRNNELKIRPLIFMSMDYNKDIFALTIKIRDWKTEEEKQIREKYCSGKKSNEWETFKKEEINNLLGKTADEIRDILKKKIIESNIKNDFLSYLQ
ncbi:MAG: PD-(D/E)XK nuclease family protein [Candidatus Gastranaerophilales bacterium]|nr:PD-(D/E)XK nuclease family protein [Candidatus Gastranaerophilales bacterium]